MGKEVWKSYRVGHTELSWNMQVKIRQDEETHKRCREMMDFFNKSKHLVEDHGGDVNQAFAVFLATEIFTDSSGSIDIVIGAIAQTEGFYPLTRENGIEISSMDSFEVDYDDFYSYEIDE